MSPIRVLIVDDHTLFRDGLSAIMANEPGFEVVGEAGSGLEAVDKASETRPDVILMDINMPELNGIEATEQILAKHPEIGITMLTMLEDNDSLFAAMCAGARGYILKGADKAEVLKTIRSIADGEALFGPAIAVRLATFFQSSKAKVEKVKLEKPFPELTTREREILEQIAKGENNHAISQTLHISSKTVSNHISNIFSKLQVADRMQAMLKARDAGLGS